MRHRGLGSRGITFYELLLVVALIAVIAGISIPIFSLAVTRARTAGMVEALGAAVRDARTRAIATGWQYRVLANGPAAVPPNAFRIEGFDPTVLPPSSWPAATTPPAFYGADQMYEPFTNLAREFGGAPQIIIPGGVSTFFAVAFDRNGQWPPADQCVPAGCVVQVTTGGRTANITVSVAGAVRIDR